jgi:hypothetical protein
LRLKNTQISRSGFAVLRRSKYRFFDSNLRSRLARDGTEKGWKIVWYGHKPLRLEAVLVLSPMAVQLLVGNSRSEDETM